MHKRSDHIRKMQAKLDSWSAEIEVLSAKSCNVSTTLQNKFKKQIESLNSKLTTAWSKIELSHHVQRLD